MILNFYYSYKKARITKCAHCGELGASISCERAKCNHTYHFPCALKIGCYFTFLNKTIVYCPGCAKLYGNLPEMLEPSKLFDTKRRLYIVKNSKFEPNPMKSEKPEIDTWRPFFYDSFNRIGNCTILSLCQNADALIKVIKGSSFSLHNSSNADNRRDVTRSHNHLSHYASLRIYWKIAKDMTVEEDSLRDPANICRDRSKAFYLCNNNEVSILEKKDITLLRKNTSDTITQRLWGSQKMLSRLHLREITHDGDEDMIQPTRTLEGQVFWSLLATFIKSSRPSFNFTNIDYFKFDTFTAEQKFPVNFWNTAQVQTQEKLLSSVDSHWMLAQNYDHLDKNNFSSDLFLENVIKINHGKEKISSLFAKNDKAPQPRKGGARLNTTLAAGDQEDLYGTVTDQRNLPMSMRYRKYTDHPSKVWVGPSKIHCQGLFAIEPYSQGDIVIEYVGEIIDDAEADRREVYYEQSGMDDCYMFRLDATQIIDATYLGNSARFLNHSCDANCKAKVEVISGQKHILIFANRDISKGEELTYFYNFAIEAEKILCLCGAPNCEGKLN